MNMEKNYIKKILELADVLVVSGFNPAEEYPAYEGMKPIGHTFHQLKVGEAVKLFACMTDKGATEYELDRVVRYMATLLESEKKNLNWHKCRTDMGIDELTKKYKSVQNMYYVTVDVEEMDNVDGEDIFENYGTSSTIVHKSKLGAEKEADKVMQSLMDGAEKLGKRCEILDISSFTDERQTAYKIARFEGDETSEEFAIYIHALVVED